MNNPAQEHSKTIRIRVIVVISVIAHYLKIVNSGNDVIRQN